MDVDGEVFNVKISPVWDGAGKPRRPQAERPAKDPKRPKEVPAGAVLSGMAGLVLSFEVKVGDAIKAGDPGGNDRSNENEETCQLTPWRSGERDLAL